MAADTRPVRDPRLRGDAAADAGLPRRAAVPRLARALAEGRRARCSVARRRDPRVAGARLQPARAQPAPRRARRRRARVARRPDRAARRRAVHRGRGPSFAFGDAGPAARHERPASRGAHRTPLRPRLRPGADGPRPHGLPGARAPLRECPLAERCPSRGARYEPQRKQSRFEGRSASGARTRFDSSPRGPRTLTSLDARPSRRSSATGSSTRATASCGSP